MVWAMQWKFVEFSILNETIKWWIFQDFKISDLAWIWWIWLEWPYVLLKMLNVLSYVHRGPYWEPSQASVIELFMQKKLMAYSH